MGNSAKFSHPLTNMKQAKNKSTRTPKKYKKGNKTSMKSKCHDAKIYFLSMTGCSFSEGGMFLMKLLLMVLRALHFILLSPSLHIEY